MPGIALSSLRVSSDFDASAYVRGAAQKVTADNQMIASDKARNASLAQADAALTRIPAGMAAVSKALLNGYSAGSQFEAIVRRIGNAVDQGMGLDRGNALLDEAYRKYGLTANAAALAEKGFVSIAGAVANLNEQYSIHNEVAARAAAEIAQVAAAQKAQAGINAATGVSAAPATELGASFSALDERGRAAEASVAALRAQIDPLGTEFGKLGTEMAAYKRFLDDGLISTDEYAQAQTLLAQRLTLTQQGLARTGAAGGVAGYELTNLSYQLNDIVTGLATGQSPFMILTQQGGQVLQIFQSSEKSVGDFAAAIGSKFTGMLTVSRLAFGGIAGAVGLGIAALASFESKQQEVARSLIGAGRGSGATVGSINSIAAAGASPTGLSVSEARELASALAQTGKVANDNILPIVQMGKDIATVYGTTAADAAKTLATAFADPVKGADDLNQRLGFLDAATKQAITNLVAQNNIYGAQVVLMNAVKGGLQDVAQTVSASRTGWTALGNAISNAWDALGKFLAGGGANSIEDRLDEAKKKLEDLKSSGGMVPDLNTGLMSFDPTAINAAAAEVDKLTAALQRQKAATDEVRQAQQSLVQQQAIRTALPVISQTQDLQNQLKVLQDLAASPDVDQKLLKVGQSMNQLQRAIVATSAAIASLPKTALVDFLGAAASPAEKLAAELEQINVKAAQIGATPAQNARAVSAAQLESEISVISARNSALGASASANDIVKQKFLELQQAQLNGAGLTKQQTQDQLDLARAQANGSLAIKAQADAMNIQTGTIGMSAGAAAEYTARMTALTDAVRNHKVLTDQDKAAIDAQAKALGEAAQANALKQIHSDISFGRQTAFLSPDDVQIAQQLKAIYPDVAQALNSVEASGLRANQAISGVSQTVSTDLVTGISDVIDGTKTFGQSFADTSKLIIRAIEEMIVKLLIVQPLMQSLQGTGSSLLGFLGLGGAPGVTAAGGIAGAVGATSVGGAALVPAAFGRVFNRGNVVPFAVGGVVSRPTYFPMANGGTGLMGEAGPEAVMPLRRGSDGKLGVSAGGSSGAGGNVISFNGGIQISVPEGTSPTDAAAIARSVRATMEQVADERIVRASRSRGLLNRTS